MVSVDKDICVGCGGCISICPMQAIDYKDAKSEINQSKCIQCQTCVSYCPVGAIKVG